MPMAREVVVGFLVEELVFLMVVVEVLLVVVEVRTFGVVVDVLFVVVEVTFLVGVAFALEADAFLVVVGLLGVGFLVGRPTLRGGMKLVMGCTKSM